MGQFDLLASCREGGRPGRNLSITAVELGSIKSRQMPSIMETTITEVFGLKPTLIVTGATTASTPGTTTTIVGTKGDG